MSALDDRLDRWANDAGKHPWFFTLKGVLGVLAIILLVIGIVGVLSTGSVFFQGAAAKQTIGAQIQKQVYTGENAVNQIAFFHNTCQTANAQIVAVQNNQARLVADRHAAKYATSAVTQQQAADALTSDETDVTGAQNALAATVADYNSRSAQSTANVFKGSGLPDRIALPVPLPAHYSINCG